MKKTRLALMTAAASLFAFVFMGCPDTPGSSVTPGGNSTSLQEQIDTTADGGEVTLDASLFEAGASITLSKAITVNGSGIEGLTLNVSKDVAGEVTLKNFKNAKIEVIETESSRSLARGADSTESAVNAFKKFGDGALSLKLEGCTVEKFSTASDLSLLMGSGMNKSVIDSLLLKKGAEDFTFVEFDETDTKTAEKSQVKDLTIEDGVKEINLIGGTFDDVNFAADFSDKVDFKYDKEFEDQLKFEDKEEFLESDKVEAKDIALADDKVVENYESTSGVFMFSMSKAEFEEVNGHFDIVFLTNEQANSWIGAQGDITDDSISFETPAYDMSIMGAFTVAKNENGELVDGLYAVYGGSKTYRDYRNPYSYRVRTLENYMTYSKEAVVVEVTGETVNIYLNKGAIRKSDLLLCSGWRPADADENRTGTSEGGSKLSNINLEGYYPFFALNTETGAEFDVNSLFSSGARPLNAGPVLMPVSSKQEFIQDYYIYNVTDCGVYPNVSAVVYPVVDVPVRRATVNYYDAELKFKETVKDKVLENINVKEDGYEYYFDAEFTDMLATWDQDGNISEWEWEGIFNDRNLDITEEVTFYARPKRTITFEFIDMMDGDTFDNLFQLPCNISMIRVYKNYDSTSKTFSNEITSIKDFEDKSTVYITYPYVEVISFGKEADTESISLGKVRIQELITQDPETYIEKLNKVLYKTAEAGENNVYTPDTLKAVELGTKVYVTTPTVMIDPVTVWTAVPDTPGAFTGEDEPKSIIYFADFYSLLQKEGHDKYYKEVRGDDGAEDYVEWTKELVDAELAREWFHIDEVFKAYSTAPDTTRISVVDLGLGTGGETYPMVYLKYKFIEEWDTVHKDIKYYLTSDCSGNPLTKEDIEGFTEATTIYTRTEQIDVQFVSESGGGNGGTITKSDFKTYLSDYEYYNKWYDWEEGEKKKLTLEEVMDWPAYDSESSNPPVYVLSKSLKLHNWNYLENKFDENGSTTTVAYIWWYYSVYPNNYKIFKDAERKAEYSLADIKELEEGTDIYLIDNYNPDMF